MLKKPDYPCRTCPLYGGGYGFVPADGSGSNGVLVVLEAAGEAEENAGLPTVGKAGHYLWSNLARVGLERDSFKIHNVLSCRPPENKLAKMPYETAAIEACSPLLDITIQDMQRLCRESGKTFTILALGRIAFKRIMGLHEKTPLLKKDYQCYPHWSEKYQAWVIAGDHPSYLMRGNHHLMPMLQFAATRAVEIASKGLEVEKHSEYLLDPHPAHFKQWVEGFKQAYLADPENTFLSYDIETPFKQGEDEEDVSKESDDDYTILRCSFCYKPGYSVSIPWRAEYMPMVEELFAHPGAKVGWNLNYDSPRVRAQTAINGDELDGMLAWHVLNSALRKGLGFVTPFYAQQVLMWKHLSGDQPAFYNCKDADMALRCWLGIRDGLKANGQWHVFERHIVELNRVLSYMSSKGVLRDEVLRREAETKLTGILADINAKVDEAVPPDARQLKLYQRTPKDTTGMMQVRGDRRTKKCTKCGALDVTMKHFASVGKKKLRMGETENPCFGMKSSATVVGSSLWARILPWKISNTSLQRYQAVQGHKPIVDWKTKAVTFDENAILRLSKTYPKDPLYPLIVEQRGNSKLLSTYIGVTQEDGSVRGGMPVGPDGRIRTFFSHNPSTLRSASQQPNLQNLPRTDPTDEDALPNLIRNLIIASPGCILHARDFSGIEAVLVGYLASLPGYIRLAKLDVHSYYTAYALNQLDGRVKTADLPDINWPDDRLVPHLAWLKKTYKSDRNSLYKHLVHGANFMQGAKGARDKILLETGVEYPIPLVKRVMDIYFALFPEIRRWHHTLLAQADRDGYVRNPFGYIHRFHGVYKWEKVGGKWQHEPNPDTANKVIAFGPQSTAAGIIKEAMLRLYFNRFEEAGQWLRLLVHDELLVECPVNLADQVDEIMRIEMERPIPELSLPKSYNMGENLVILTEAKRGFRWGEMQ